MTPNEGTLHCKTIYNGTDSIWIGNGSLLPIKQIGSFSVPTVAQPLILKRVLHVPSLKHNLLSVKQLCQDNNCIVVFDDSSVCVKDNTSGNILLRASSTSNVYPLAIPSSSSSAFAALLNPATGVLGLHPKT